MKWNEMQWNGMKWNGIAYTKLEWICLRPQGLNTDEWCRIMKCNGVQWSEMERSVIEWNEMEWNGMVYKVLKK
jgi:hypothetical protein